MTPETQFSDTTLSDLSIRRSPFNLSGKKVLALGATGVLGQAAVEDLVRHGAQVAVLSRDGESSVEKLEALKAKVGEIDPHFSDADTGVVGFAAENTTSEEGLKKAGDQVLSQLGSLSTLICMVGGNRPNATVNLDNNIGVFDLSLGDINETFNLNVMEGFINPAHVIGQMMAEASNPNDRLSIIGTSSESALKPLTKVGAYGAAKRALKGYAEFLTVQLPLQYPEFKEKFRINCVTPGFSLTDQNRALLVDAETGNLTTRGQAIIDHTPFGRFADPYEVAPSFTFLASDASMFMSGQEIVVDGGFGVQSI